MAQFSSDSFGTMGTSEEQIELLNVAENFCRERSPIEKVRRLLDDELGYDPQIWKEVGELGWLAIAIPEGYDGVGLSLTEVVPVIEQMGRRMMASPFMATTLAAQAILTGGTDAQKRAILPQITAGAAATLAISEANGDWDLTNIAATATPIASPTGTGYRLSGTKTFVMDLTSANWIVASVKIGKDVALVIIDKAEVTDANSRRENLIDETKRGFELTLDGIEVPADAVMDVGKLPATLEHIHLVANLLGAAELVGGALSCIEYTVEYLCTRKQFGKLIGSYQALKHPTVDAYVDYEKARSLLYGAAFSFGETGIGEISTRMAKAMADKALSFAADRSIQFHGGFGFTYDCDAQLYRRRAVFHASQYGDARYHKQKLADLLF